MDWRVPLADLDIDQEEKRAVLEVLDSRWLTMGAITQSFEQQFAEAVEARYALAVTNATVALHLACLTLDIKQGDEVIVPSLTFVATANAVLYTGAEVRFADIVGADELTISPQDIERRITPNTKAIIVMHYGGYPCRMPEIMDLASKYGLALIEDAAHAPGAALEGRSLGTWGDVGCFSFFSNKNLSTAERGMLVTNREDIAERVKVLRSHGMTSLTWDRHLGHAYTYDVVDLGYNYRIDEIRSALGLVQLGKLAANNQRRSRITEQYRLALADSGVEIPFKSIFGYPAYHLFPVLLSEGSQRKAFIDCLRGLGIQTSIHYPPVHLFTYYQSRYGESSLPVTESIAAREVTLPLYPGMKSDDVDAVVEAVRTALNEY